MYYRRRVEATSTLPGRSIIDGHEVVDLGLPGGYLIATCNLGADTELDFGDYYAFGAVTPWNGTFPMNANPTDSSTLSDDRNPVKYNYGSGWDLISFGYELLSNTTTSAITIDGNNYIKLTSKTYPDRYVLLPCAGYGYQKFAYGRPSVGYSSKTITCLWTLAVDTSYSDIYGNGMYYGSYVIAADGNYDSITYNSFYYSGEQTLYAMTVRPAYYP